MLNRLTFFIPLILLALLASQPFAAADGGRKFAYTYEATTEAQGDIGLETWVTWKHHRGPGRVDEFDFRHELEWGVTNRLTMGLYLANWNYTSTPEARTARYASSSLELIYSLTDPATSWLGTALYGEVTVGDTETEIEGKLLLQKNLGRFTLAANVYVEARWSGENLSHQNQRDGEINETLGVSYRVGQHLSVGAELLNENHLPDWGRPETAFCSAGPNVTVRCHRAFATVTALFRLTNNPDEPNVQTRLIFGYEF